MSGPPIKPQTNFAPRQTTAKPKVETAKTNTKATVDKQAKKQPPNIYKPSSLITKKSATDPI